MSHERGLTMGGKRATVVVIKGNREGNRESVAKVTRNPLDKVCNTW
jgi:hypothetical protein